MKEFDTITAIATAVGESGISIIRVSGINALSIVTKIFKGKNEDSLMNIKPYTMKYGYIFDNESNEIIDEVIVSYMKGPRSYTAEDTIEINCHGGIICTKRILELVIKYGARLAEPGEFTKRAFLNGRIDLSQAEAVMDIITAKTELSMKTAINQSTGSVNREIKKLRDNLLALIANIEATVDYPEDDLEELTSDKVRYDLGILVEEIDSILNTADEGKIIREGINIVIIGKPNVGKSSFLNVLVKEERAIVTDVPGTTRDVIEEYINLDGIPVKLIDTAGIRETEDIVEKIGVKKSKEKIDEADLVILILDASRALEKEDFEIINQIKGKKYLILLNKSDLENKFDCNEIQTLNKKYLINISAKTGEGIDILKDSIKELFFSGEVKAQEILITNTRHKEALIRARENCIFAIEALKNTEAIDLASIDIRNAWYVLGEITGDTLQEDMMDKIFSKFCLGK